MKEAGTVEVIVLYVIDEHELGAMVEGCGWLGEDPVNCLRKLEEAQKERARKELERMKKKLEAEGIEIKTLIEKGTPYKKIIETAEKEKATLIVMGSHRKGVLKELLIGSVSENVVRHTKKPVLIIR